MQSINLISAVSEAKGGRMRMGSKNGDALMARINGRRILAMVVTALAIFSVGFFTMAIAPGIYWPLLHGTSEMARERESQHGVSLSQRKLLSHGIMTSNLSSPAPEMSSFTTQRVGDGGCSKDDIVIHQGATSPLPNGIPTYTVQVLNVCAQKADTGCELGQIHFSCGWFSSARLINPRVFRRLHFDDCLLNDGRPLPSGSSLSFQYANTYQYQLSVSTATCVST